MYKKLDRTTDSGLILMKSHSHLVRHFQNFHDVLAQAEFSFGLALVICPMRLERTEAGDMEGHRQKLHDPDKRKHSVCTFSSV